MASFASLWRHAAEQSRNECLDRADRVLAHEDLAARLTEPPASIREPYKWNGWIPPRTVAEDTCGGACGKEHWACTYSQHRSKVNDSPVRKQLVDIAAEAMRRQQPALDLPEQGDQAGQHDQDDAGQAEQVAATDGAE